MSQRYKLHMTQSGEQLTIKGEKQVSLNSSLNLEGSATLYQMIFVLKGSLVFQHRNSTEAVSSIACQCHNLCCIRQKSLKMVMGSPEDEVICISLSNTFMNRHLQDHAAWRSFIQLPQQAGICKLSEADLQLSPEISSLLLRLNQKTNNSFFDQLLLESKTLELLALQLQQLEQLENKSELPVLKKEEMDKMIAARAILINNIGQQLSLRALAHLVGTNEFNLKRNFKIAFGNTVHNHLNQYKMELARTMIKEQDITIAEVAEKMGYKYATHFSSAFKKYFGYLPNALKAGRCCLLLFPGEIFITIGYSL